MRAVYSKSACAHDCIRVGCSGFTLCQQAWPEKNEQTVWVFISVGQWLKVRPERTCWVDRLSATSSGQMGLLRTWGQPTRSRVIISAEVHMTVIWHSGSPGVYAVISSCGC